MSDAPAADFLRSVLKHWPAPFAAAKLVNPHQGFSGALIGRIAAAEQEFALRGWPSGSLPRTRLAGLHHFLRYLRQQGLSQVSVPIATIHGPTLVESFGHWWQLEPWMSGRASFHEDPSAEKVTSAMQVLARLHHLAERYEPEGESAVWFSVQPSVPSPGVIERIQLIERWKDTDPQSLRRLMQKSSLPGSMLDLLEDIVARFHRHADAIQDELQLLLGVAFRLQPCPRDLWHDHVLFTGDEVTGLIDFGACRSENPMTDLSRLLGSFFPNDPPRWQAAIDSYEQFRPILPEERRLLRAFDRSQRLLAGMMWVQRLTFDVEIPLQTERVRQRLEGIITGLRSLEGES